MFLQKIERFVKTVSILLAFVLAQIFAGVNSKTAEEISPHGLVDLWNNCNSTVEMETLVGNVGRFMKPLLYYKNIQHCKIRLKNNTFLVVDKEAVSFAQFPKECLMYIYEASSSKLNVKTNHIIPNITPNTQDIVVELVPEDLQDVMKILDLKPVLGPVFNSTTHHDVFTANASGHLEIQQNARTYFNFGAYKIFQNFGLRSIDEIRESLYSETLEQILLPNQYVPRETYNISWNNVMIPYVAEVHLKLRVCDTNEHSATIFAMVKKEKISNETIRVERIKTTNAETNGPTTASGLTNLTGATNDIAIFSFLLVLFSTVLKFLV